MNSAVGSVSLKANQELVLRYRAIAFDGDVPAALLTKLSAVKGS